jgi:hypothetical protein
MMMPFTVHAIYGNGAFWPVEPVDLPEKTPVEFGPRVLTEVAVPPPSMGEGLCRRKLRLW